jgi:hypothetical protein
MDRDLLAKDRSWIDPVSILAILTNTIQDRSRIDTSGIIAKPAIDLSSRLDLRKVIQIHSTQEFDT